jgi:hypothetical protein
MPRPLIVPLGLLCALALLVTQASAAGICSTSNPCANAAQCSDDGANAYTCACQGPYSGSNCSTIAYLPDGLGGLQCPIGYQPYPACNQTYCPSSSTQPTCALYLTQSGLVQFDTNATMQFSLWGGGGAGASVVAGGGGAYMSGFISVATNQTFWITVATSAVYDSTDGFDKYDTATSLDGVGGFGGRATSGFTSTVVGAGGQHSAIYNYSLATGYTLLLNAGGGGGAAIDATNRYYGYGGNTSVVIAYPSMYQDSCVLTGQTLNSMASRGYPGNIYGGGGGGCSGGQPRNGGGSYASDLVRLVESQNGFNGSSDKIGPCSGSLSSFWMRPAGCSYPTASYVGFTGLVVLNTTAPASGSCSAISDVPGFRFANVSCPTPTRVQCPSPFVLDNTTLSCRCPIGSYGAGCSLKYCSAGADTCTNSTRGTCIAAATSATCNCSTGYWGVRCENVNQCAFNPCTTAPVCTNTTASGGYKCSGDACSDFSPCKNAGVCTSLTNATGPTYNCSCAVNWTGQNCTTSTIIASSSAPTASSSIVASSSAAIGSSSAPIASSSAIASSSNPGAPASSSRNQFSSSILQQSSSNVVASSSAPLGSSSVPIPYSSSITASSSNGIQSSSLYPAGSSSIPSESSSTLASSSEAFASSSSASANTTKVVLYNRATQDWYNFEEAVGQPVAVAIVVCGSVFTLMTAVFVRLYWLKKFAGDAAGRFLPVPGFA